MTQMQARWGTARGEHGPVYGVFSRVAERRRRQAERGGVVRRLHHFFERSCDADPDAPALVCGGETLSYAELDARANRLARALASQGGRPGARIGILLTRSVHTYVSLLAVLKCGAAFVPIDPAFPAERIAFIVADAELGLLLTTSDLADQSRAAGCPVLTLDTAADAIARMPAGRLGVPADDDALCYIIYTSGTTGHPKGVAVNQSSICNFLSACLPIYGVQPGDRVYQGMTISFDFSIEEIWPTLAAGATLVAGPTDHRRLGPALGEFLDEQQVTVLYCVPTLLATIDRDLPRLRTLIVGGEACPHDLVRRWSRRGRRMLNTYGPTEATVTATWGVLRPDRPVTIGRPLPTYTVHLLDDALNPVAEGEPGEISIGGPGVAVGYVNRPELTAARFPVDLFAPSGTRARLYRTGDLGRLTADGEIEFLGRIDSQVKLRGFRVELAEIEAVLLEDHAVGNAVVTVLPSDGAGAVEELVAYVTLRAPTTDPAALTARLRVVLRSRLPGYMIPGFLELVAELPTLPSGKADRSRLPRPTGPRLAEALDTGAPPETAQELQIAAAWSRAFGQEVRSAEADFFLELGGHSLFAAVVISDLRRDPALRGLSIADLYAHPTIRGLARHLERQAPEPARTEPRTERLHHGAGRINRAGAAQMALLYLFLIPWLAPMVAVILLLEEEMLGRAAVVAGIAAALVVGPLIHLGLPLAAKWLLLGRVRPGRHPLWGWFFCRWWLVRRLIQTAPIDLLAGSPLLPVYLRLLGARIGRDCHIGTARFDLPDLITIGDGASLGYEVELDPGRVADGWLHVERLVVGTGAYVGTNSVIEGGAVVGPGARVAAQSLVGNGHTIPDGESWAGSPSRRTDSDPQLDDLSARVPDRRWSAGTRAGFAFGALFLQLLPTLLLIPSLVLIWGVSGGDLAIGLALTPLAGLIQVLLTCAVVVLGKRLALPALRPGVYPLHSWFGVRKWFADRLMTLSLGLTNTLYSTLYVLPFLRLLGTRVGRRAEVSTVSHIDPDLLTLGDECFAADLAVIGEARFHNGHIVLGTTEIGARGFVGNAAIVPGDTRLGHDSLLGVLSVSPPDPVPAGTSWLGSPALFLPRRQASERFDESLTFRPPARLVACRLAIELLRVILPSTFALAAFFVMALVIARLLDRAPLAVVLLILPAVYLGAGLVLTLAVAALKWLVIGRYRPRVEPQWSHFVWRTELITGLYENVVIPWLVIWIGGTPLMGPALRLFGAKIGRRVFLETNFLTEFDLVRVGDDAVIGDATSLQTHLFEDRVMKLSVVNIGPGCTIGARSVVLYDAELGAGSELDSLSLVMKGESLPPDTHWRGIPARLKTDSEPLA